MQRKESDVCVYHEPAGFENEQEDAFGWGRAEIGRDQCVRM